MSSKSRRSSAHVTREAESLPAEPDLSSTEEEQADATPEGVGASEAPAAGSVATGADAPAAEGASPEPKPSARTKRATSRTTAARTATSRARKASPPSLVVVDAESAEGERARKDGVEVRVRRLHRRDLNRTWEFLKLVFRDVNRETVEYQRPRSKNRFLDVYEEKGEQLLFEVGDQVVGYAEIAFDANGADNWINPRYFEKRGMRPLYVEELAVHPDYQGKGVGGFMLDQLQHLARVRGCTHLVLEVAENNEGALSWYRKRNFFKLDAAIFLAQKVPAEPELLPPRKLPVRKPGEKKARTKKAGTGTRRATRQAGAGKSSTRRRQ